MKRSAPPVQTSGAVHIDANGPAGGLEQDVNRVRVDTAERHGDGLVERGIEGQRPGLRYGVLPPHLEAVDHQTPVPRLRVVPGALSRLGEAELDVAVQRLLCAISG